MADSIPVFHPTWITPPPSLRLFRDDVHLWFAQLPLPVAQIYPLFSTLSTDEQARAEKFRFERDRHRFIAGRGMLRAILSRYLEISPEQITFSYQLHGKPILQSRHQSSLRFNVSHSHECAIYIVADQREVGVDVEYQRTVDVEGLAKRFFSAYEYRTLRTIPAEQQLRTFFHLWTCKEAYLKATGDGLVGLSHVEVHHAPDNTLLLRDPQTTQPLSRWAVQSFVPCPDYRAAFVLERPIGQVSCFQALNLLVD